MGEKIRVSKGTSAKWIVSMGAKRVKPKKVIKVWKSLGGNLVDHFHTEYLRQMGLGAFGNFTCIVTRILFSILPFIFFSLRNPS